MHRIEIEDFSGPLELLLTLVQQEELSLSRIYLLDILNQVIKGLEEDLDLNDSGDLLMIISTLMELKSKLLLPGEVDIGEEIQALKDDLLAKVLVHRRLSQVLDSLEYRLERRAEMFGRPNLMLDKETVMTPMDEQNPFVLFSSLSGLLELARQDNLRVQYDIRPIDEYFVWMEKEWEGRGFTLRDLIRQRKDLLDATGVIIAVLEFVRLGRLVMSALPGDVAFEWGDPEIKKLEMSEDQGVVEEKDESPDSTVSPQLVSDESELADDAASETPSKDNSEDEDSGKSDDDDDDLDLDNEDADEFDEEAD